MREINGKLLLDQVRAQVHALGLQVSVEGCWRYNVVHQCQTLYITINLPDDAILKESIGYEVIPGHPIEDKPHQSDERFLMEMAKTLNLPADCEVISNAEYENHPAGYVLQGRAFGLPIVKKRPVTMADVVRCLESAHERAIAHAEKLKAEEAANPSPPPSFVELAPTKPETWHDREPML